MRRETGQTVEGYSLTAYDVRSLSTVVTAETDRIEDQLRQLGSSTVRGADLDTAVAADYLRVVHGTLADSLRGFRAAAERFAATLRETYDRYEAVDEDVAMRLAAVR